MIDIRHGDCITEMQAMDDACVDAIICDLPYGTTSCKWDTVIPFAPLWEQYKRVIKPNGAIVLTASQPFTTALISSNAADYKYSWVWVKTRSTDFVNAKNKPMKKHEDVCIFSSGTTANGSKRKMPYNPQGLVYKPSYQFRPSAKMRNGGAIGERPSHVRGYTREWENYPDSVLEFANPNNGNVHPTQKPVTLIEYLIRTYTNEGETVLDNCMGSGTTGVACLNTGRRFIGIEKDAGYFNVAAERIAAAREGLGLFAVAAE